MGYHVPSDKLVETALKKVLKGNRSVQSQKKLKHLIIKELNTKKKTFGVSESRLRKIAINSNFVKLEIHSREGDPKKFNNMGWGSHYRVQLFKLWLLDRKEKKNSN